MLAFLVTALVTTLQSLPAAAATPADSSTSATSPEPRELQIANKPSTGDPGIRPVQHALVDREYAKHFAL